MKTATLVRKLKNYRGDARLYRLSEPVPYSGLFREDNEAAPTTDHVIVSATVVGYGEGPETYIFPAAAEGDQPVSWLEMDGSFKGGLDHEVALRRLGFEVDHREAVSK